MSFTPSPPEFQQEQELIIRISPSGWPVVFPICSSDKEYSAAVQRLWRLIESGQLLESVRRLI